MSPLTTSPLNVQEALKLASAGAGVPRERLVAVLSALEDHECWTPLFKVLSARIAQAQLRSVDDYVWLARCQKIHLENVFQTAQTCQRAVVDLQLPFIEFRDRLLARVLGNEDWASEATILQTIKDSLKTKEDKVLCLERLCLLYDKKISNENLLGETYEQLLKIAPHSMKALRYFKMFHAQEGEWETVLKFLRQMLHGTNRPAEAFRIGQEMAATLLYQLDKPLDALRALEEHCSESPLDASTIQFDAYRRLHRWDGCLTVLKHNLLAAEADHARGALHYRSGEIAELAGNEALTIEHYSKAAQSIPGFIDPLEKLIALHLGKKQWSEVARRLQELKDATRDESLRVGIQEALNRLSEGLKHAR
jgi:hypothetical protein